jgi:predicted TIM-barrel fold metal-dependent hydrolase
MVKLDMPIFLHPTDFVGASYPLLNDYGLKIPLLWPFDTAQAMSRLVFRGVVDKFPKLTIIIHHIGSVITIFIGRLQSDPKYRQTESGSAHQSDTVLHKFKSSTRTPQVNSLGLKLRRPLEFFGANHFVFGSDYPYRYNDGQGLFGTISG